MMYIRRISDPSIIAANQEAQTEQIQPQQQNNFGVAGNSDHFEIASPDNSNFVNQTNEYVEMKLPSSSSDMTVEASSIFAQFDGVVPELESVTPPKPDRLKSLREKREEFVAQLTALDEKILEAQTALHKTTEAMNSDKPIPDEVQAVLGQLGILGIIGGLPAIPIIGGILGMLGLSEDYKQKMKKAIGELTRQLGELEIQREQLMEQLEEVNREMEKIEQEIKEKFVKELEENQRQYEPKLAHKNVIKDFAMWRSFASPEDVIQKEETPFVATFNPTATEDN